MSSSNFGKEWMGLILFFCREGQSFDQTDTSEMTFVLSEGNLLIQNHRVYCKRLGQVITWFNF
jgi:hypothetical protein